MRLITALRDIAWLSVFAFITAAVSVTLAVAAFPLPLVIATGAASITLAILGTKE